jgi:DNA-binding ferritin-like protein (Dps family)
MANMLEKLRKENNKRDKLLTKENSRIMTDMVVYLRCSNLCDYDIEVIRRELFGMIYEAQLRNEPADQVIGDDPKGFCEELMKSGRQKDFYEKFLEWAYIVITGIGILFLIEIFLSSFFLKSFLHGNFNMPVSAGFLVSTVLIISGAVVIYWFMTKHSFELPGKGLNQYKILFIAGFMFYFTGAFIIKALMNDISLLRINVLIGIAGFAAAYLLVKVLGDRNANLIAATHK